MRKHGFSAPPQVRSVQVESGLGDADENTDSFAMPTRESLTCVTGVFERLPTGLQDEPLLGIHVLRFARGDAEELSIELRETLEEAAPLAVAPAALRRAFHIGIIESRQGPALGRNLDDAVLAGAKVLPELIEGWRLRIAPADADDRNRLTRRCIRGCLRSRGDRTAFAPWGERHLGADVSTAPSAAAFSVVCHEIIAQATQSPVLIEQRFRQQWELLRQLTIQLHDHQRVDAVALQCLVRPNLIDTQSEHPTHGRSQSMQSRLAKIFIGRPRLCLLVRLDDVFLAARCRTAVDHDYRRQARFEASIQCLQPVLARQWMQAALPQRFKRDRRRSHTAIGPDRPVDTQRPPRALTAGNERVPIYRKPIEELVCESVVALARIPPHSGNRREQNQKLQPQVSSRTVEMERSSHLGGEYRRELLGALPDGEIVPNDAGGVHDTVEMAVSGNQSLEATLNLLQNADIESFELQANPGAGPYESFELGARRLAEHAPRAYDYDRLVEAGGDFPHEHLAQAAAAANDPVDTALAPRDPRIVFG